MSQYNNLYSTPGEGTTWGYFDLGPIRIPPTPPTVGMVDAAGTGQVWFLMWDGAEHLVLTDEIPTYALGDYTIFEPGDGPYLGGMGWRLGVTTAAQPGSFGPPGTPHLIVDFPSHGSMGGSAGPGQGWTTIHHPLVVPNIAAPGAQSYPESTGWPTPQPPTVPGIPSSSPVPVGGGFAAFDAAIATNTPPSLASVYVALTRYIPQPWHLEQVGGG